jgi:hypothetical protein
MRILPLHKHIFQRQTANFCFRYGARDEVAASQYQAQTRFCGETLPLFFSYIASRLFKKRLQETPSRSTLNSRTSKNSLPSLNVWRLRA